VQAVAERIPLASSSVDTVVAGQAFHWFETDLALAEIARVLRPGGTLALVWNLRDETVPWVRRLGRLIGSEPPEDPTEVLEESGLYDGIEHHTFRHWQEVQRDSLIGLVRSRAAVADLPDDERAALLDRVGELYDDYGRGHDGMLLPYHCEAFRCRVSGLANFRREQDPPADDGLLIDFS
jgi:SAM-dependent methyltransferase